MNEHDPEMKRVIEAAKKQNCTLCGQAGHALICFPPKHGPLLGIKPGHTICVVLCQDCHGKGIPVEKLEDYLLIYDGKPLDPAGLMDQQIQKRGLN